MKHYTGEIDKYGTCDKKEDCKRFQAHLSEVENAEKYHGKQYVYENAPKCVEHRYEDFVEAA